MFVDISPFYIGSVHRCCVCGGSIYNNHLALSLEDGKTNWLHRSCATRMVREINEVLYSKATYKKGEK